MSDQARVYLLHIWRLHGSWRIAVQQAGEDRAHLFTRAEQVAEFISALTSGTVPDEPGGSPPAGAPIPPGQ